MNIRESIRQTFEVIGASKVRSFLTMLGINFGVGSLIAITIVGLSMRQSVNQRMNQYGSTLMYVMPDNAAYAAGENQDLLDDSDLRFFKEALPGVTARSTFMSMNADIGYQGKEKRIRLIGTIPDHFDIMLIQLQAGRFFNEADLNSGQKLCILGAEIAGSLFGATNPLGRPVQLFSGTFTVVGVRKKIEQGGFLFSDGGNDNTVYVPLDFVAKRVWQGRIVKYWLLLLKFDNMKNLERAVSRMENYLNNKYGFLRGKSRFRTWKLESFMGTVNSVLNIVSTLISVLAGISLTVGGLGIMNIMLVTVTERTREIGLRMALGAGRRDILRQFLIEAVTLCLIGGGIGVCFGIGAAVVICLIVKMNFMFSLPVVLVSLFISTLIGLLFGIYPAYKASRLTPIDALRAEVN